MPKLITIFACALLVATSSLAQAQERRRARPPEQRYNRDDTTAGGRSTTVDRNGLCQRDNGRPLDFLNLNHRCDREEFWNRLNDRGSNRR